MLCPGWKLRGTDDDDEDYERYMKYDPPSPLRRFHVSCFIITHAKNMDNLLGTSTAPVQRSLGDEKAYLQLRYMRCVGGNPTLRITVLSKLLVSYRRTQNVCGSVGYRIVACQLAPTVCSEGTRSSRLLWWRGGAVEFVPKKCSGPLLCVG